MKNKKSWILMAVVLAMGAKTWGQHVVIDDGKSHSFDSTPIDSLTVRNSGSGATFTASGTIGSSEAPGHVTVLDGARVSFMEGPFKLYGDLLISSNTVSPTFGTFGSRYASAEITGNVTISNPNGLTPTGNVSYATFYDATIGGKLTVSGVKTNVQFMDSTWPDPAVYFVAKLNGGVEISDGATADFKATRITGDLDVSGSGSRATFWSGDPAGVTITGDMNVTDGGKVTFGQYTPSFNNRFDAVIQGELFVGNASLVDVTRSDVTFSGGGEIAAGGMLQVFLDGVATFSGGKTTNIYGKVDASAGKTLEPNTIGTDTKGGTIDVVGQGTVVNFNGDTKINWLNVYENGTANFTTNATVNWVMLYDHGSTNFTAGGTIDMLVVSDNGIATFTSGGTIGSGMIAGGGKIVVDGTKGSAAVPAITSSLTAYQDGEIVFQNFRTPNTTLQFNDEIQLAGGALTFVYTSATFNKDIVLDGDVNFIRSDAVSTSSASLNFKGYTTIMGDMTLEGGYNRADQTTTRGYDVTFEKAGAIVGDLSLSLHGTVTFKEAGLVVGDLLTTGAFLTDSTNNVYFRGPSASVLGNVVAQDQSVVTFSSEKVYIGGNVTAKGNDGRWATLVQFSDGWSEDGGVLINGNVLVEGKKGIVEFYNNREAVVEGTVTVKDGGLLQIRDWGTADFNNNVTFADGTLNVSYGSWAEFHEKVSGNATVKVNNGGTDSDRYSGVIFHHDTTIGDLTVGAGVKLVFNWDTFEDDEVPISDSSYVVFKGKGQVNGQLTINDGSTVWVVGGDVSFNGGGSMHPNGWLAVDEGGKATLKGFKEASALTNPQLYVVNNSTLVLDDSKITFDNTPAYFNGTLVVKNGSDVEFTEKLTVNENLRLVLDGNSSVAGGTLEFSGSAIIDYSFGRGLPTFSFEYLEIADVPGLNLEMNFLGKVPAGEPITLLSVANGYDMWEEFFSDFVAAQNAASSEWIFGYVRNGVGFDITVRAMVPEPGTLSVLLAGVAGLGLVRRRKGARSRC